VVAPLATKPLQGHFCHLRGHLRGCAPINAAPGTFGKTEGALKGLLPISHTSLCSTTFQGVIGGMGGWVKVVM
jgi:hypothetical protein